MKPYSHPGRDSGNGGHKTHQVRTINPLPWLHFLLLSPSYFLSPIIALGLDCFSPTWSSDFLHHFLRLSFCFFPLQSTAHIWFMPHLAPVAAVCARCRSLGCGLHALLVCSHIFSALVFWRKKILSTIFLSGTFIFKTSTQFKVSCNALSFSMSGSGTQQDHDPSPTSTRAGGRAPNLKPLQKPVQRMG